MRRHDVALRSIRRCFKVVCLLGKVVINLGLPKTNNSRKIVSEGALTSKAQIFAFKKFHLKGKMEHNLFVRKYMYTGQIDLGTHLRI